MFCQKCEREAVPGRIYCEEHLRLAREYQNQLNKRRWAKAEAEGLCRRCLAPLNGDKHKNCFRCRQYVNARGKQYYRNKTATTWKVVQIKDVQCPAKYKLACECGFKYWCGENTKQFKYCPMCGKMKVEAEL